MKTILAVDVGRNYGVAVMRDGEIVYTQNHTFQSLATMKLAVQEIVDEWNPDIIISGRPTRFPQVIASHSKYLAILELICELYEMGYHEIIDSQAKKTVFGKGVMPKEKIQEWAEKEVGKKLTQDVSDAVLFCYHIKKITSA